MSNEIKLKPKFSFDDEVFFIGDGKIEEGIVVSINYSDYSYGTVESYKEKKIKGIHYGVEVCMNYSSEEYKVVEIKEDNLFSTKEELAKSLIN